MKRGFLNKPGSKKRSKLLNPEQDNSVPSQKPDVEKETPPVTSSSNPSDSKGAIPNLHKPPASLIAKAGKTRFVFREWPRNPEGPIIRETPKGKEASNGLQLWGATLYDFFSFRRSYQIPNLRTLSTGSKLAAHMREIGELDWADDEMHWASREEDPVEVPPCDIGKLIKDGEFHVKIGLYGKPINSAEQQSTRPTVASGETSQSVVSVFDPSNYPPPWPLVPFSAPTAKLQKRIPFHLLPQKLVVHDPWNLLFVDEMDIEGPDVEWTSKDDIIRTYHLKLSKTGKETVEKERELRAELDAKCKDIGQREGFINELNAKKSGPVSPAIMVFPPLCPPPPESVPEAHLYLSPAHRSGVGNHSVVYNAEWELPRSMLVKDVLCQQCMGDKVAEDLKEKQEHREYHHGGVKNKGDGSESSQSADPKSAKITITNEYIPGISVEIISAQELKKDGDDGEGKNHPEIYTVEPAQTIHTRTYEGPFVKVFPEVDWQNPERGPYCSHVQESLRCEKVPLTAKVNVAVKLSKPYDAHLAREAENYQSFPSHLFEHWNGYNVIPPLHDPVPVGAVVPQFYGYYVPEKNKGDQTSRYLSSILLVEDCGIPIDPEALNEDDKQECASLLYRLHEAGWNHNSFAERNLLTQPGPLSQWPTFRGLNDVRSFRLIDFGRSSECDSQSRAYEETNVDQMFNLNGFF